MKATLALTIFLFTALVVSSAPTPSMASELAAGTVSLLPFSVPTAPTAVATAAPVANWTHSGCWTPRSGSPCVDIYRDGSGQLWICKACGQTGNPSPGKCSKTSQAVLDRGLWCS